MARSRFNPLSFMFLVAIVLLGLYGNSLRDGFHSDDSTAVAPNRPPGSRSPTSPTSTRPVHSDAPASANVPPARVLAGYVQRVIDGDTFDLRMDDRLIRIRLAGIDAPEINQPYGDVARDYLSRVCEGQFIHALVLELDRNGRSIADVYLQEHWLNGLMIRAGLAWHFTKYDNFQELADEEAQARAARRGLWADPTPVAPWDWRRR